MEFHLSHSIYKILNDLGVRKAVFVAQMSQPVLQMKQPLNAELFMASFMRSIEDRLLFRIFITPTEL